MSRISPYVMALFILLFFSGCLIAGKVIEEIVSKVNDDIITKTEFENYERSLTREIYSTYTGEELDQKLKDAKEYLLYNLINEKLLFQKAEQQYDMKKLGESIMKEFREQKNLKSDKDFQNFLKDVRMTEDELREEILRFQAPQMILNSLIRDEITVSDKEIDNYYEKNIEDFTDPERVTVREIILLATPENREAVREKGREILRQVKEGADFAKLAEQLSDGATREKGGLLGTFVKGELAADLDTRIFQMKSGDVSDLIEASYGFHIVKLEEKTEKKVKPLPDVRFEIYDTISGEKYSEAVNKLLTKMWEDSSIEVNERYQHRLSVKHKAPTR
ncbi:MAG: peptidylprolyl isomerase [Acidobacteriota bacterium]